MSKLLTVDFQKEEGFCEKIFFNFCYISGQRFTLCWFCIKYSFSLSSTGNLCLRLVIENLKFLLWWILNKIEVQYIQQQNIYKKGNSSYFMIILFVFRLIDVIEWSTAIQNIHCLRSIPHSNIFHHYCKLAKIYQIVHWILFNYTYISFICRIQLQ